MNRSMRIGFIGAGKMGSGIASNLLKQSFAVTIMVHRHREVLQPLFNAGAAETRTIADTLRDVEVVITCLPSLDAVTQVYDDAEGINVNLRRGMLVIDCTTNSPEITRRLAAEAGYRGAEFVDAPLGGGPKLAAEGSLHFFVGGSDEGVRMALPILEAAGSNVLHVGSVGSGQIMKILRNGVAIMAHSAVCEAMVLAQSTGIDLQVFQSVLLDGPHASSKMKELTDRLIGDDHSMAFTVDGALKDVTLFSRFAADQMVPSPTAEGARNAFALASMLGFGAENISRVASALADLGGLKE